MERSLCTDRDVNGTMMEFLKDDVGWGKKVFGNAEDA